MSLPSPHCLSPSTAARSAVSLFPHILHRRDDVYPLLPLAKLCPPPLGLERCVGRVEQCAPEDFDLGGYKDLHVHTVNVGAEDFGVFIGSFGNARLPCEETVKQEDDGRMAGYFLGG